jgi:hypothetical protein
MLALMHLSICVFIMFVSIDCVTTIHACKKRLGVRGSTIPNLCKDHHRNIPVSVSLCPNAFGYTRLSFRTHSYVTIFKKKHNLLAVSTNTIHACCQKVSSPSCQAQLVFSPIVHNYATMIT